MSASRLFPKTYNGKEESAGFIGKNTKPRSATSPHYTGRIYVTEPGWFWVSGWVHDLPSGKGMRVSLQPMSDQQATQYCSEVNRRGRKADAAQHNGASHESQPAGEHGGDPEIPF